MWTKKERLEWACFLRLVSGSRYPRFQTSDEAATGLWPRRMKSSQIVEKPQGVEEQKKRGGGSCR